jgi:hypothetical protein
MAGLLCANGFAHKLRVRQGWPVLPCANGFAHKKTKKARTGRAFFASDFDLQLREGPPTVGVMVHAIGVAGGQHMTTRGTRVKVHGFGGNWMHAVT